MIRLATATAVFGLVVAACGGQVAEQSLDTVPPQGSTSSTSQPPTADTDDPAATAAPPATTAPLVVDGPPAPDFALALSDGLGFILSEEQRPVYMVFWAEW